ncbi:MAG TPA: tonB-system energizer ExbB [Steroidobacteraceae bacterium]|nr:tonB-system energizer ExbB [Steroidobacteraceae bacterium]
MPSTAAISIFGMVGSMDAVVKGILALLIVASLVTWTVCLAKCIELSGARRRLRSDLEHLGKASSLDGLGELASDAGNLVTVGIRDEIARAGDLRLRPCAEGLKERVTVLLPGVEAQLARRASRGIGVVASVGSTAPFVGLFGTVWGIMNSFVSIAHTQATSLAVVAPGIAEALLTTAAGLAAAVPAVLIYNGFVRFLAGYRALLADVSNAAACLLSLDLQRIQMDAAAADPELPKKVALGL